MEVRLRDEPESLRRAVGKGFGADTDVEVRLRVRTHLFEPQGTVPSPVFWGYLIHIKSFTVVTPVGVIDFEDTPDDPWPADRIERLRAVRGYIVERIRIADNALEPTPLE